MTPTDCLLVGAYLPAEKSPYEENDIYSVSLLEDCLVDLIRVCGDIPFIICGDLNARIASMNARNVDPVDDVYEMNRPLSLKILHMRNGLAYAICRK